MSLEEGLGPVERALFGAFGHRGGQHSNEQLKGKGSWLGW